MRQLWVLAVLPLIAACHTLFPHGPPAPTPDAASPGDVWFDQPRDPPGDSSSERRPATDGGRDGAPVDDLPIVADLDPCAPLAWDPSAGRCGRLTPSNVAKEVEVVFDNSNLKDLALAQGPVTFNTDDGGINPGGNPAIRGSGPGVVNGIYFEVVKKSCITTKLCPSLGLFVIRGLTIQSGVQINAIGKWPLVIYATEDSSIAGTISVSASGGGAGPGGVKGGTSTSSDGGFCEGGEGKSSILTCLVGGAGAGFGGKGGAGGMTGVCAGGPGGTVNGDPALATLRGGCGGAKGNGISGGAGGNGGGALQISVNGTLALQNASFLADGASGSDELLIGGGGGGGSGGGVLLEAAAITGSGTIKALGGNGGAGNCAAGGAGGGSAFDGLPGQTCASGAGAGGGGGSAGRIRIHAKSYPGLNTIPPATVDKTLPVW